MALKFGTSGVRGLVTDMTDLACYHYTMAFVNLLTAETPCRKICLAGDHRYSSPRIMAAVGAAVRDGGFELDYGGEIPTPAIAHYAMSQGAAAIMVTGSHIPEDRNGIKFYMPWGEILKAEEKEISQWKEKLDPQNFKSTFDAKGMLIKPFTLPSISIAATEQYIARYTSTFQKNCLVGKKIVFYQHSSVARTILDKILLACGATVINVGWSDKFIPVDTEAVDQPERLAAWVKEHQADALVSTDGDADRPLLVDNKGRVVRGDVLGILAAQWLHAEAIATPISCNTAVEKSKLFPKIKRTKIGSPYVIEAMTSLCSEGARSVVGYEANGGFLTASVLSHEPIMEKLNPLPTRDAVLPLLAVLNLSSSTSISKVLQSIPQRVTCSGLLRGVEMEKSTSFLNLLRQGGCQAIEQCFTAWGSCESIDETDGFRISFSTKRILHFRPSGNAPEFRCYAEAQDEFEAQKMIQDALSFLKSKLL
jgi:phosphomannomutase